MVGVYFPHPRELSAAAMTQQSAIAAGDHGEAALDQIHGCEATRRGLPGFVGEIVPAEQHLGDFAVTGAAGMAVYGLQHAACAPNLLPGQSRVGRHGPSMEGV